MKKHNKFRKLKVVDMARLRMHRLGSGRVEAGMEARVKSQRICHCLDRQAMSRLDLEVHGRVLSWR